MVAAFDGHQAGGCRKAGQAHLVSVIFDRVLPSQEGVGQVAVLILVSYLAKGMGGLEAGER